jgi:SAM-dependent methyltransferase
MAFRFPLTHVVGVDAAPVPLDTDNLPPNLRFEVDDVNKGLPHFHDTESSDTRSFDLIHMRMVQTGLEDLDAVLIDLQRCLKPGGLLIIIDMTPILWDQSRNMIPMAKIDTDDGDDDGAVSQSGSWLARVLFGMFYYEPFSLSLTSLQRLMTQVVILESTRPIAMT